MHIMNTCTDFALISFADEKYSISQIIADKYIRATLSKIIHVSRVLSHSVSPVHINKNSPKHAPHV